MPKTAGMARNATGARQVGYYCRKSQSTHYSSGQALKGLPLFISRRSVCLGSPLGDPTGRTRAALVPPCATHIGNEAGGVFFAGTGSGANHPHWARHSDGRLASTATQAGVSAGAGRQHGHDLLTDPWPPARTHPARQGAQVRFAWKRPACDRCCAYGCARYFLK